MQGTFTIGFSGKKADIVKVESAYQEHMDDPNGYIDTEKTEGFEQLADGAPAKILFRTNTSINVRVVDGLFKQLVESAPAAEAGCWWASLETENYFRTCMYSKAGSAEYKEFEDTIRQMGDSVYIYLCDTFGKGNPVAQLLLELYHKKPFDVDCKPVEPDKDWDYDKLPRTFEYGGISYCYDDGKVKEVSGDEAYDEHGYWQEHCGVWTYYDEDEDITIDPEDFEDEIILRWVCGKSEKKWIPGKMKNISTINGVCYYLFS